MRYIISQKRCVYTKAYIYMRGRRNLFLKKKKKPLLYIYKKNIIQTNFTNLQFITTYKFVLMYLYHYNQVNNK